MKKKVSCHIITYNQKEYISKCIESALMQKTNFTIEIIIGDDNSTDGTREILIDYGRKYPDLIKLNLREMRGFGIPGKENFVTTLAMCTGEYVSFCDGDDYWTDPLKLQKQVDFLEANPDYIIHSGNAIQLTTDIKQNGKPIFCDTLDATFEVEDFLSNNNIITCSVMFRNVKFQFPDSFCKVTFGDWFLYVILMKHTGLKVYRSAKLLSVYRVHERGVMSNLSVLNYYDAHILQIITIYKYLGNKGLQLKELNALNDYSLKEYRLVIKDKLYLEALKIFTINFKYCKLKIPFRKYVSALKQIILEN